MLYLLVRSKYVTISVILALALQKDNIYTMDVKYNDELKQKTKKYPFFPEKTKANIDHFTEYEN